MLNYEIVKKHKRDLMLGDPDFLTGRGRIESLEFHSAEFCYLKGVEDGGLIVAKLDEAMALMASALVDPARVLGLLQDIKEQLRVG